MVRNEYKMCKLTKSKRMEEDMQLMKDVSKFLDDIWLMDY